MSNTTKTPLLRLHLITHVNTFIETIYFVFSSILAFLKFERKPSDCMCLCKKKKEKGMFYDLLDK